jgi:hypothetical protein
MAGLAPRSLAWAAFAQRAMLLPGRGRWMALPRPVDLEAVVLAVFRTLGQRPPAGIFRQLAGVGMPTGGYTVDDVRDALLAVGVPLVLQDG